MTRLPAVAVRQYRRTVLSALALVASLVTATSCGDAPTAADSRAPRITTVARSEETAPLDTTIFIPAALDTARRDYCNGYPFATPVEQTGPAGCAMLLDARGNDPLPTFLASVPEFFSFVARCAAFDTTGRIVTTTARRRWSAGIPGRLQVVPNAEDGGETAVVTPLDTGVYHVNCEVANDAWGAGAVYASEQVSVYFAPTELRGATITPDTLRGEIGEPLRFVFHPIDQYGRTDRVDMSRYWVDYQIGDPGLGWVQHDGAVFASAPGVTTVQAFVTTEQGEVRSNVATLEILPSMAAAVSPSETSLLLFKGEQRYLWATVTNRFGAQLHDKPVTWTSLNPGIAAVSADGIVTAKATGTATLTVRADTATATVTVKVVLPRVTTIVVSPATASILAGGTKQLAASAYNQRGEPMYNVAFAWTSGNTAVATVSASGVVSGIKAGSVTIRANASGVNGTSKVTVTTPPSSSVCGDPAGCLPVQEAYFSHFANGDCSGTEYYYTAYNAYDGIRRSWDGTGVAGKTVETTTVRSYKGADGGCRQDVWGAAGYTFSGMSRVYRTATTPAPTTPTCGDPAGCLPVQELYFSHFANADCTGTEYYYTAYFGFDGKRRSWNGTGIAGKTVETVTVKSYRTNDGGGDGTGCRRDVWGAAGYTFGGMSRIYR